jgi:hypothetical protein
LKHKQRAVRRKNRWEDAALFPRRPKKKEVTFALRVTSLFFFIDQWVML